MKQEKHVFETSVDDFGKRLDVFLSERLEEFSRSFLSEHIKSDLVFIDGARISKPNHKLKGGETVEVTIVLKPLSTLTPDASIKLNIIFEDEELLILNKPPGLVVHPGAGNQDKTLLNAILAHNPKNEVLPRAGLIHRLDKDTSGLLMVAKTMEAYTHLVKALQKRNISREYLALCNGIIDHSDTIETLISRHPKNRLKMAVSRSGKEAITHLTPLKYFKDHTLLQVKLETGRTHQIRVHLNYIKHPIVGDHLYGGYQFKKKIYSEELKQALEGFKRQALHAKKLTLAHPKTRKLIAFDAPMPQDMDSLLMTLKNDHDSDQSELESP